MFRLHYKALPVTSWVSYWRPDQKPTQAWPCCSCQNPPWQGNPSSFLWGHKVQGFCQRPECRLIIFHTCIWRGRDARPFRRGIWFYRSIRKWCRILHFVKFGLSRRQIGLFLRGAGPSCFRKRVWRLLRPALGMPCLWSLRTHLRKCLLVVQRFRTFVS